MEAQRIQSFPDEALEHVLSFLSSDEDRSSVSLVSKSWYEIERRYRSHVYIGNSYAVSPSILIRRFTNVRSITIKGRHKLCRVPKGWPAGALPWVAAVVAAYPAVEEIRLKRMVVSDEALELIGRNLKNLRALELCKCEGFGSHGLAFIASNLRYLRRLELITLPKVQDLGIDWLLQFPDSYTSLESLDLYGLKSDVPFSTLELLVRRCPNVKKLRLNPHFTLESLILLLPMAPNLVDVGTGFSTMLPFTPELLSELSTAFEGCKKLRSLSRLWGFDPCFLPAIYPVCSALTFLDLKYTGQVHFPDLVQVLRRCPNLQHLYVSDFITDGGLNEVATSCKELQVLKVFLSGGEGQRYISVTERGLVSVAVGCPKLHSIVYYCMRMTNEAMVTLANHKPNLISLHIQTCRPRLCDALTKKPLDDGYIAILEHCKALKRLKITGLVTDRLLVQIGTLGKKLEVLHISYCEGSDRGFHHVLSGCNNLRKLAMVGCSFGGLALLGNSDMLERIRSLWMSNCKMDFPMCEQLVEKHPRLNVEVMNREGSIPATDHEAKAENIYIYKTLAGPRLDFPPFIWSANEQKRLRDLSLGTTMGRWWLDEQ